MSIKKIFLVAINSRFNHVSLAVRALTSYIKKYSDGYNKFYSLEAKYFTINQPVLEILQGIALEKPDAVFFSVYIWNVEITMKVIAELRKVLPECLIGAGGPEVTYDAQKVLNENKSIDLIMAGEGEVTLKELCESFSSEEKVSVSKIKGLYVRAKKSSGSEKNDDVVFTGARPLIQNLDELPFPYDDGNGKLVEGVDADNSIIYYESSRGCPFHCSYCLSSVDKTVRFSSLERVQKNLDFFLKNNVRLVKFVDRTYNLNEERYIAIWKYIETHWNNKTTFHFEIAAQQFTEAALNSIQNVPYGMMQFEIGIQSTNPPTLEQVGRPADLDQIHHVLSKIPKTIHVHLDLIAGLPYESPKEFASSFNYTISQYPEMLQLGFLKVLHGTPMEEYTLKTKGFSYMSNPPYEVLSTPWVSYSQMQDYKKIENLVDNYYNSQNFIQTMKYIVSLQKNAYKFFTNLSDYFTEKNIFDLPHKVNDYYSYLYDFLNGDQTKQNPQVAEGAPLLQNTEHQQYFAPEEINVLNNLLRFDYTRKSKPGTYPSWYRREYDKQNHRAALEKYYDMHSTRDAYTDSSYESFTVNPITFEPCAPEKTCDILFLYGGHHLTGAASKTAIRTGDCHIIICNKIAAEEQEEQNDL
ncbi:MAG: DUF4080 domain-containing protein [Treponema sp.]